MHRRCFRGHEVPLYGRARFDADRRLSDAVAAAARTALGHVEATLGAHVVQEFALHAPALHEGLIVSGDRFVATAAASAARSPSVTTCPFRSVSPSVRTLWASRVPTASATGTSPYIMGHPPQAAGGAVLG